MYVPIINTFAVNVSGAFGLAKLSVAVTPVIPSAKVSIAQAGYLL